MKTSRAIAVASLVTGLLVAPIPDLIDDDLEKKSPKRSQVRKVVPKRLMAAAALPDDPSLPGLVAIRAACVAGALPVESLGRSPVDLLLRGYTEGSRATLEVRDGHRRIAFKAYAESPASEAALYQALAAAGLAGNEGVRVPPLLAWNRQLRVLVIGWLEGPTVEDLIENGQGQRAGELAALWFQRATSLPANLGRTLGAVTILRKAGKWADALVVADPALGADASALATKLERHLPKEGAPRLVHGTLYARHILDLGDAPGVIDWQKFGHGPLELDAGNFLATTWRIGLRPGQSPTEAARAEQAFLAGTAGILDERAVNWHRSATLLRLANKLTRKQDESNWSERAHVLLNEAARLVAGHPASIATTTGRGMERSQS